MSDTDCEAEVIYVIDDDASVRASIVDLFASVGLPSIAFNSVNGFLVHPRGGGASCLVLDVRMPGQSGTEFHLRMTDLGLQMPVIFITGHGDIAMGVSAMKNGAVDFLSKPFRDQDLLDSVQNALDRDRQRLARRDAIAALRRRHDLLTPGERDVLNLVVQGLLNKQIAAALEVKEITVKVRRANVMQKMQAGSLAELVLMHAALFSGE